MGIRIERLNEKNFLDYESLTCSQAHGGCYCAFWHQKWSSMADWEKCQKETPLKNRQIVYEKMRSGFHVGVLAYDSDHDDRLLAWVSVGPIIEYYWTWKRVAQLGEEAKLVAGITCFTIKSDFRGMGLQERILQALKLYGKGQGWKALEGYPFDMSALEKHKDEVVWPGLAKGFLEAGFRRTGAHWLSSEEAERSVYRVDL